FDAEQSAFYVKRFRFEPSDNQQQLFISEQEGSYMAVLSQDQYPQLEIIFGGKHTKRSPEKIDVEEFIGAKSFRAKGKRLTNFQVQSVCFIEPLEKVLPEEEVDSSEGEETEDTTKTSDSQESSITNTSQPTLF
ncbi:MAG: DNA gyrase/topoisomerase IV subunit A, partial [Prevotellaceae bacterium]|nr:DNA gyrase/topoisomerase IV subunit A [Prevotellaceae bacterium]